MNFLPVLVMNVLLIVITLLLVIASRLLVTYGKCKVTLTREGKSTTFEVQGGGTLLSSLIEQKVQISSSCGGKGSCGYCKIQVPSGGGQILPTEEVFMSRKEKQKSMRLACQVKVKNDIEVEIPDYLTVVRELVENKKFDPNKRWKVTIV